MPPPDATLTARLRRLRLLAMDVDGVLTDGRILWGATRGGELVESKSFHVRDGLGISVALAGGLGIAWITGRTSAAVQQRAAELRVPYVTQWARDKARALRESAAAAGIPLEATAFLGDDWNDWPALETAGIAVVVADAPADLRARVDWVTDARGGEGAAREVIEAILRAQERWEAALDAFFACLRGEHDSSPPGLAG
ncbi:MAG: HAD hydrolase family protein [Armatimonadetes bacterium]|nr:HAD hydrolase family protein [Armatimonadota bacterium]